MTEAAPDDAELLSTWRRLQDAGAVPSPFATWQWTQALGAIPEVGRHVSVLAVRSSDRTVGLFPIERWRDRSALRVLGAAGALWLAPDHLDVVAEPEHRAAVASALVAHLARAPSWHVLDLSGVSAGGPLAAALATYPSRRHLRLPRKPVVAPFVSLSSGEGALSGSRNLRQQVARGLRAAERSGGGLSVSESPDEVGEALGVLMDLHRRRFEDRSAVFATPARRRFHLHAGRSLAEAGMARVYRLRVGDEDAALLYAFRLGKRLYYYSMGMRPELGRSPGLTLLGQVALHAAEEGCTEFDLLRGDHGFKLRFATGVREDLQVRLVRPTLRVARVAARRVAAQLIRRAG